MIPGNKYFCTAPKHSIGSSHLPRLKLSFSAELLVIHVLVSHLSSVLPAVIVLRFDLYVEKVMGFVTRGVTTLVQLSGAVCMKSDVNANCHTLKAENSEKHPHKSEFT